MSDYKPVPVAAAIAIADNFEKSMVVVLSYDPVHELTHTTTYGRSPSDKRIAAKVGEACTKLVGDIERRTIYEGFNQVAASERAAAIEQAVRACKAAEHALRSVLATRDGISDELLQQVADECGRVVAVSSEYGGRRG